MLLLLLLSNEQMNTSNAKYKTAFPDKAGHPTGVLQTVTQTTLKEARTTQFTRYN